MDKPKTTPKFKSSHWRFKRHERDSFKKDLKIIIPEET